MANRPAATPHAQKRQRRAIPLEPTKRSRIHGSDAIALTVGIIGVTTALWVRGGGIAHLARGGSSMWLSIADITGLWAGLAGLGGLVLVARPASLERRFGFDRMVGWHRWVGIFLVWSSLVHTIASVVAYETAAQGNWFTALVKESIAIQQLEWMVSATVSMVIIAIVATTSWRRIRRRMSYETWYFIHVLGYVGIVFALGHALVLGADIRSDKLAWWWWAGLYAWVFALVIARRFGPAIVSLLREELTVSRVVVAGPEMVAITVSGPGLTSLRGKAGQFYRVRFGNGWWWQSHPYSVSAVPTTAGLEFSVKNAGDGSLALMKSRLGTRVWVEGPYGVFTREAAEGRPLLLVGGGSGLAPIRAILQEATNADRPIVVLRAPSRDQVPYAGDIEKLAVAKGGAAFYVLGRTADLAIDPFAADVMLQAVPDLTERAVFLCGPTGLVAAARDGLREAGVSSAQIHSERFDY